MRSIPLALFLPGVCLLVPGCGHSRCPEGFVMNDEKLCVESDGDADTDSDSDADSVNTQQTAPLDATTQV